MTGKKKTTTASRWDEEYRAGRYVDEPPVEFVEVIGAAVYEKNLTDEIGLYIGCGNGRNYVPLIERHELDLVGLDISGAAIQQLRERMPARAEQLIHGGLSELPSERRFGTVIAIQVFQHGSEIEAHEHFQAAVERLLPGGLFCVRVNAVGTEIEYRHEVVETNAHGGFTIRYEDGPKTGLVVHFFALDEMKALTAKLTPVSPLRRHRTERPAPGRGHWDQWEGIWTSDQPR